MNLSLKPLHVQICSDKTQQEGGCVGAKQLRSQTHGQALSISGTKLGLNPGMLVCLLLIATACCGVGAWLLVLGNKPRQPTRPRQISSK